MRDLQLPQRRFICDLVFPGQMAIVLPYTSAPFLQDGRWKNKSDTAAERPGQVRDFT